MTLGISDVPCTICSKDELAAVDITFGPPFGVTTDPGDKFDGLPEIGNSDDEDDGDKCPPIALLLPDCCCCNC